MIAAALCTTGWRARPRCPLRAADPDRERVRGRAIRARSSRPARSTDGRRRDSPTADRGQPDRQARRRDGDHPVDHDRNRCGRGTEVRTRRGRRSRARRPRRRRRAGSVGGPLRCRARSITSIFSSSMSSSIPVPRPVTSPAERPVSAAMTAADGVVFPMPISPPTRRSAPPRDQLGGQFGAHQEPASDRLVARHRRSSTARFAVPAAHVAIVAGVVMGGQRGRHADIDDGDARPGLAREHVDRRAAGAEVGDHLGRHLLAGQGVTPSATHPVVAGEHRDSRRQRHEAAAPRRLIADSRAPSDSNRPSEPRGLVSRSWCAPASTRQALVDGADPRDDRRERISLRIGDRADGSDAPDSRGTSCRSSVHPRPDVDRP